MPMRFGFETTATPEQVTTAFTDFTDRRLDIWKRSLAPSKYELRDLGDTWAVAREGSAGSPFWVVLRYDWSEPGRITWTVVESSYGGSGQGVVAVAPLSTGGSRVEAEWASTGARGFDRVLIAAMCHGPVRMMVARMWRQALDGYAASSTPGAA